MKIPILFITVLGYSCAVPNGYYHQEYNYKTSQSAYKNNELQHKTDDQGYYKKDGDLENRYKPIEDSNSEHSEYVNPKLQNSQYGYDYNTDSNSHGRMRADGTYGGAYGTANNLEVEGVAQRNRIAGSQAGYSAYGSNYGSSNTHSNYGVSSNLRTLTTRLQQDLEREMLEELRRNSMSQSRADLSELERQWTQKLNERLNNELSTKYGQQIVRSGMSYSMTGGRLQPTANYDNQELTDLKTQVENSLLNQLRTQYSQYSYGSSSSSNHYNQGGSTAYITTQRPYYPTATYTYRPIYPTLPTERYVGYNHNEYGSKTRYTPIPNPESISTIASRVQSQLDANLNNVLEETRRTHFATNQQYSLTNPDTLLERLRNELRNNVTYQLDEIIRQNYGNQMQKDGYLYSVGPNGALSGEHNYGLRDLENLKEQIERNLVNKLDRDFETSRKSWSSSSSYNSQSSYGANYGANSNSGAYQPGVKTQAYNAGHTYAAQSSGNMAEMQRQLQSDLSRQLSLAMDREAHGSYIDNPQNYQTSLQELSDQLNRNLTRNLQEYSASGSYAAYGNFDRDQMADMRVKLEQSLMNQLRQGLQQSFQTHNAYSASSSSGSSGSYRPVRGSNNYQTGSYSYGCGLDCQGDDPNAYHRSKRSYGQSHQSHYEQQQELGQAEDLGQQVEDLGQQMEDLGQQVEDDSGLTQKIQPQYGASSHYHSSKVEHHSHNSHDLNQQQQPQDLGWKPWEHDSSFLPTPSPPSHSRQQGKLEIGQHQEELDDLNLGQKVEQSSYRRSQHSYGHLNQHQSHYDQQQQLGQVEDLGQQVEDSSQQVKDYPDLIPQVQAQYRTSSRYHSSRVEQHSHSNHNLDHHQQQQQPQDLGWKPWEHDSSLLPTPTPPSRTHQRGKLGLGQQQQEHLGQEQEVDDSDMGQHVEETGYHKRNRGKLQLKPLDQQQQQTENLDQQQTENIGQQQTEDFGQQQVDDSDLGQHVEETVYHKRNRGKLQLTPLDQQQQQTENLDQQQTEDFGQQQVDDSDLGQHVEETVYHKRNRGKLQLTPLDQQQQQTENLDQQQTEDSGQQQVDDSDLGQHIEETGYHKRNRGKLQLTPLDQQQPQTENLDQQQTENIGQQQVDDSDLGQHVEETVYHKRNRGKLQLTPLDQQQQQTENLDQQQTEDSGQQQVDDSDLGQHIEETGYHKRNRGKLQLKPLDQQQQQPKNLDQQQTENLDQQQTEDLDQQQVDDSDLGQHVEETEYHRYNRGKLQLKPLDQQHQETLGQQQVNDLDLGQVEETGFQKHSQGKLHLTPLDQHGQHQEVDQGQQELDNSQFTKQIEDQHITGLNRKPNRHSGIQRKPIDVDQEQVEDDLLQHVDQEPEKIKPAHSKVTVEQLPDNEDDLTQQVEQIDPKKMKGPDALPKDISKQTEFITEKLSKKLETAIIGFCGTDKLNEVKMREQLTEDIKKNVTEEFRRGYARYYLQNDLGLSEVQILKVQTLILEKLFAKLETGIEFAKRQHELKKTDTTDVLNEPDLSGIPTTDDTQQAELPEGTIIQTGSGGHTTLTQTTRHRTVITTHTQTGGNTFGVTDQGQFIKHPQTREDAEKNADSLILALRQFNQFQHKQVVEQDGQSLDSGEPTEKTIISSGTSDDGGKYYSRTTTYGGGRPGYSRTSTITYTNTGTKPVSSSYGGHKYSSYDVQEQLPTGNSLSPHGHHSSYGQQEQVVLSSSILHGHQHSNHGHEDDVLNSNVSPYGHHHSSLDEPLSQHSSYGQHELLSSNTLHNHQHTSYGQEQEVLNSNVSPFDHPHSSYGDQVEEELPHSNGSPYGHHHSSLDEPLSQHSSYGQHEVLSSNTLHGHQHTSYGHQEQEELSSHVSPYGHHHSGYGEQVEELPHRTNLGPHTQHSSYGKHVDDSDLGQQVEEDLTRRRYPSSYSQHSTYGQQQVDDSDMGQQVEVTRYHSSGKIQSRPLDQQQEDLGQQQELKDSSYDNQEQEVLSSHVSPYGHRHSSYGEQVEEELTHRNSLESHSQHSSYGKQQIDDSDLGQQVEEELPRRRHPSSHSPHLTYGQQQVDYSDLGQQVEEELPHRRNPSSHSQHSTYGQQQVDDNDDLVQQQELNDSGLGQQEILSSNVPPYGQVEEEPLVYRSNQNHLHAVPHTFDTQQEIQNEDSHDYPPSQIEIRHVAPEDVQQIEIEEIIPLHVDHLHAVPELEINEAEHNTDLVIGEPHTHTVDQGVVDPHDIHVDEEVVHPAVEGQEDLAWWQKAANKVKYGAHVVKEQAVKLKEKVIG